MGFVVHLAPHVERAAAAPVARRGCQAVDARRLPGRRCAPPRRAAAHVCARARAEKDGDSVFEPPLQDGRVDIDRFPSAPSSDARALDKPIAEYEELHRRLQSCSVFLVGMMGSGKTTVAKVLAKHLKYNFLDSDDVIQSLMRMPMNDVMEKHGEDGMRQVESAVLQQLAAYTRSVIATGGGAVVKRENWGALQSGVVVWLDAPPHVLYERVKHCSNRPLLKVDDPRARLQSLLDERRAMYRQADVHVPVGEDDGDQVVAFNVARGLIRFIEANMEEYAR